MAGRPRKPTHLKVVAGTAQPCRTNKAEPTPERKAPEPPRTLSKLGRVAWDEAMVIAESMGVLTVADPLALAELAETVADLRAARAALARPLLLPADEGVQPVQVAAAGERYYWTFGKSGPMRRTRPEVADIADASRRLALWASKFGLTPADRSRVAAAPPAPTGNPFADL